MTVQCTVYTGAGPRADGGIKSKSVFKPSQQPTIPRGTVQCPRVPDLGQMGGDTIKRPRADTGTINRMNTNHYPTEKNMILFSLIPSYWFHYLWEMQWSRSRWRVVAAPWWRGAGFESRAGGRPAVKLAAAAAGLCTEGPGSFPSL